MKPDTVRLILVRHGEVDANRTFHYLGRRDDDLNETGSKQALALALVLAELPIDAIVSSPLRRTLETARRIGERGACEVELEPRLIELDFGSWEGHSRTQVIEKSREDQMAIEAWELDSSLSTPGGESLGDVQMRIIGLANEFARNRSGRTVVLVSHMGPIKALLCAALDLPLNRSGRIFLDPATISVIDWGPQPVVRLVNSHAHLGFAQARWMRAE